MCRAASRDVLEATVQVVDEMRLQLPAMRRARDLERRSAISAHARAVRANQEQAEITW